MVKLQEPLIELEEIYSRASLFIRTLILETVICKYDPVFDEDRDPGCRASRYDRTWVIALLSRDHISKPVHRIFRWTRHPQLPWSNWRRVDSLLT